MGIQSSEIAQWLHDEQLALMRASIKQLSYTEKQVIDLYCNGWEIWEISMRIGLSSSRIYQLRRDATEHLKELCIPRNVL